MGASSGLIIKNGKAVDAKNGLLCRKADAPGGRKTNAQTSKAAGPTSDSNAIQCIEGNIGHTHDLKDHGHEATILSAFHCLLGNCQDAPILPYACAA